MAQLQGHLPVVAGGDEGDGLVADDEPLHEFVDGAVLDLGGVELGDVRQGFGAVAGGVLVEGPDAHPALGHLPVAFEPLGHGVLQTAAARLDGEHLEPALGGGQVKGGVDPVEPLEHGHRMGTHRGLRADGHERLERVGELDGHPPAFGDLPLQGVEPLRQGNRRGNRTKPGGVVGIGVKQGEFHQTGSGIRVRARDPACAQCVGIETAPGLTQFGHRMGMRLIGPIRCQISTPQGPEHAGT